MVLEHIPIGKQNAITRSELVSLCGLSDRKVRQEIEDLRHQGILIANLQDGKGYFICRTDEEIEEQREQIKARAKSILHYLKFFKVG